MSPTKGVPRSHGCCSRQRSAWDYTASSNKFIGSSIDFQFSSTIYILGRVGKPDNLLSLMFV